MGIRDFFKKMGFAFSEEKTETEKTADVSELIDVKQILSMKKCPYCKEDVKYDALKCRYCGEWLVEKEKKSENKINPEELKDNKYGSISFVSGIVAVLTVSFLPFIPLITIIIGIIGITTYDTRLHKNKWQGIIGLILSIMALFYVYDEYGGKNGDSIKDITQSIVEVKDQVK